MITVDNAGTPLELAENVASRFPVEYTRIDSLREVAIRYARQGEVEKGVAVQDKCTRELYGLAQNRNYPFILDIPRSAIGYHALGRRDISLDVLKDSIGFANQLRPKYAASLLTITADVAVQVGEAELANRLVTRVSDYVRNRKRFRSSCDERFDLLVPLYLKLGMVDEAIDFTQKLTALQKADAFTELAANTIVRKDRAQYIGEALRIGRRLRSEYTLVNVADVMCRHGDFCRASELIRHLAEPSVSFEGKANYGVRLLDAGRLDGTVSVLEELGNSSPTFYYFNHHQIGRLVSLLVDGNAGVARTLINRVRAEADHQPKEKDRLLRLTRMVGLVAMYSRDEAEILVDTILKAELTGLDRRRAGWQNPTCLCILMELLLTVVDRNINLRVHHITHVRRILEIYGANN